MISRFFDSEWVAVAPVILTVVVIVAAAGVAFW
jgi:hypothetical protein